MSLKIGIIGLPNVGKSTLFNALISQKKAKVSDYPFCTVEPNIGMVKVPDQELEQIAKTLEIEKTVPATLEFVDIAGLVKGAHKGEGLGNEFLANIQSVDILCQVLPYFDSIDSIKEQVETIKTELVLKDLHWLGQALKQIADPREKKILEKIRAGLDDNKGIIDQKLGPKARKLIKPINLLTAKQIFFVANVKESDLSFTSKELGLKTDIILVSALTEAELIDLDTKDAQEYRESIGLKQSALDKIINKAYALLDLISFYTIKEDNSQAQAWAIKKNTSARKAAGKIHTDFADKFIQAQIIAAEDLIKTGSLVKAAEKGLIKARGEDYPVKNKEIISFKHG